MVLWQRWVGWVENLSMFGLPGMGNAKTHPGQGSHLQRPHIPLPHQRGAPAVPSHPPVPTAVIEVDYY